jgi:hypothetical protein
MSSNFDRITPLLNAYQREFSTFLGSVDDPGEHTRAAAARCRELLFEIEKQLFRPNVRDLYERMVAETDAGLDRFQAFKLALTSFAGDWILDDENDKNATTNEVFDEIDF